VIPTDTDGTPEDVEKWILTHRPDAALAYYDGTIDHIRELSRSHCFPIEPVGLHVTTGRDFCRMDPRIINLGRTSISVLARELFLNH
jgi:hypothetical protein